MGKQISAIVAIGRDGAIGKNGDLLWHLSADMKHFKSITMGHSIVMGRTTFESFPKGALPGRQNIVVTRNADYHPENVTIAHSIADAIDAAEMPGEVMIIGGAQIYAATIDMVSTIYLTRVDAEFPDADTFFPTINPDEWEECDVEHHEADDRNPLPYTFLTLKRKR